MRLPLQLATSHTSLLLQLWRLDSILASWSGALPSLRRNGSQRGSGAADNFLQDLQLRGLLVHEQRRQAYDAAKWGASRNDCHSSTDSREKRAAYAWRVADACATQNLRYPQRRGATARVSGQSHSCCERIQNPSWSCCVKRRRSCRCCKRIKRRSGN